MRKMKLSDIKIKSYFTETMPKQHKLNQCRWNYYNWHGQDRYIVVNHKGFLIDGYIQYLVLKENNVKEADVIVSDHKDKRWRRINPEYEVNEQVKVPRYKTQNTTYIFGIHPNNVKHPKERVWRVPNSWKGWEDDVMPGDKILVSTKNGVAPIIVTQIKWLDQCPVDMPVRKVFKKIIN